MYRILLIFVAIASIININYGTPLDDYVNKPDPAFAWKLIQTYPFSTYTIYLLNMTSQQWLDGIIKEIKTIFLNKIILLFSFLLITIHLVALYDYHRT
jgi:hypothetical protein